MQLVGKKAYKEKIFYLLLRQLIPKELITLSSKLLASIRVVFFRSLHTLLLKTFTLTTFNFGTETWVESMEMNHITSCVLNHVLGQRACLPEAFVHIKNPMKLLL